MYNPFDANKKPGQPVQTAQQGQPQNPNKRTGTGYTNVSRIIGANQNNRLGQAVAGGVSQAVGQSKENLGQAQSRFSQGVEQNTVGTEANKQVRAQALEAPETAAPEVASRFEQFRSGQYAGPTEIEGSGKIATDVQNLKNLGQADNRGSLLQRFVGGAGYGAGKQRLDSVLLGQSAGQGLNRAFREARGVQQNVASAAQAADAQAKLTANQNRQFADETRGMIGSKFGELATGIDAKAAEYNARRASDEGRIKELSQKLAYDPQNLNQQITDADYQFLKDRGFDADNEATLRLNVGDYLQLGNQAERLDVANQQEKARALGLKSLIGQDINQDQSTLTGQLTTDDNRLGKLRDASASKFDLDRFKNDRTGVYSDQLNEFLGRVYQGTGVNKNPDQVRQEYAAKGITDPGQILQAEEEKMNALASAKNYYNQQVNRTPFVGTSFKGVSQNAGKSDEQIGQDVDSFFNNLKRGAGLQMSDEEVAAQKARWVDALSSKANNARQAAQDKAVADYLAANPVDPRRNMSEWEIRQKALQAVGNPQGSYEGFSEGASPIAFSGKSDFGGGINDLFFNAYDDAGGDVWAGGALRDSNRTLQDSQYGRLRKIMRAPAPNAATAGNVGNGGIVAASGNGLPFRGTN